MENYLYPIGTQIKFIESNIADERDIPYDEQFKEGDLGIVIGVYPSGGEYLYTIQSNGIIPKKNVHEHSIQKFETDISVKVQERLDEKQAKKQFKDTEGRVSGSKKELAAFRKISGEMFNLSDLRSMEQDEKIAIELIKKDKVIKKINPTEERDNGVSSGACYIKTKIRECFPAEPLLTSEGRTLYVTLGSYLNEKLPQLFTLKEVEDFRINIRESLINYMIEYSELDIENMLIQENKIWQLSLELAEKYVKNSKDELNALGLSIAEQYDSNEVEFDTITSSFTKGQNIITYEDNFKFYGQNQKYRQFISAQKQLEQRFPSKESVFYKSIRGLEKISGKGSIYMFQAFLEYVCKGNSKLYAILSKSRDYYSVSKSTKNTIQKWYETAEDFEGIDEVKYAEKYYPKLKELEEKQANDMAKIEESKTLASDEQFDVFFKSNRGWGYSGLEFMDWKPKKTYYYYEDAKTAKQKEQIRDRWIKAMTKEVINPRQALINEFKQKYIIKPQDWSWAFSKKGPDASSNGEPEKSEPKKPEIVFGKLPPLSNLIRKGGMKILDDEISEQSIIKQFGFRSVQFGQSLKDTEAKEHIRWFLAGMADFCEIINWDAKYINQRGGLSVAFAARGRGKALAHYESLHRIINISKMRGGGALAHEYMHYLDNILPHNIDALSSLTNGQEITYRDFASTFVNIKKNATNLIEKSLVDIFAYIYKKQLSIDIEGYNSGGLATIEEEIFASDKKFNLPSSFHDFQTGTTIKPDNIDDYLTWFRKRYAQYNDFDRLKARDFDILGSIVKMFGLESHVITFSTSKSLFFSKSSSMKSPYWIRPHELLARAFETYMFDKLAKVGRANNYLVSGAYFDHFVYPQGEEREVLFYLYDNLMTAIKTELKIGDFIPWTTERVDEFIVLKGDEEESVDTGIIVDDESGEVIDRVGNTKSIKAKLKTLIDILKFKKMLKGGIVQKNEQ